MTELEVYPPFTGFPSEGITFFRRLKANNKREWFKAHKADYEEFAKFPMQSFVFDIREHLPPGFVADPRKSIFRIYRDVRFSSDKSPYKTHIAAYFQFRGGSEGAGFYFHVEPGEIYAGGGIYMPASPQLKKIRRGIADNGKEFAAIVENRKFRKTFSELEGEKLLRSPLGFSTDHPMIEYLKMKSFFAGVTWKDAAGRDPRLVERVVGVYRELLPLVKFLNRAVGLEAR